MSHGPLVREWCFKFPASPGQTTPLGWWVWWGAGGLRRGRALSIFMAVLFPIMVATTFIYFFTEVSSMNMEVPGTYCAKENNRIIPDRKSKSSIICPSANATTVACLYLCFQSIHTLTDAQILIRDRNIYNLYIFS